MHEVVAVTAATAEDVVRRLTYEGWCELGDVVDAATLAEWRPVMVDLVSARGVSHGRARRRRIVDGLLAFDRSWVSILGDVRLSGAMETLHAADWRLALHAAVVVQGGGGGGRSSWRADWPFQAGDEQLRVQVPYGDLGMGITAVLCLDDAGGHWVVPGSHRDSSNPGRDRAPGQDEDVASSRLIPAAAGSMVLMDTRLWRADGEVAAGADHVRIELTCIPWWLNATALLPGLADYELAVSAAGTGGARPGRYLLPLSEEDYEALPEEVRLRVRHLLAGQEVVAE